MGNNNDTVDLYIYSKSDNYMLGRKRLQKGRKIMNTICASSDPMGIVEKDLRIRKLTPKECWRLMGFTDTDFEKASQHNSNAQLYKQAGNSIVVNVLEAIFRQML